MFCSSEEKRTDFVFFFFLGFRRRSMELNFERIFFGVDVRGPENDERLTIGVLARSIGNSLHISNIRRVE